MADTGPGKKNNSRWLIGLLVAAVVVALAIWLFGRADPGDNLTPAATAVNPETGQLEAAGVAAQGTGAEMGQPGVTDNPDVADPGLPPTNDGEPGAPPPANPAPPAAGQAGATGAATAPGAPPPG